MPSLSRLLLGIGAFLIAFAARGNAAEKPTLAAQIDQRIADRLKEAKIAASPLADDAEFLRRVYLDLTGRIPSYDQTVAFLDSKDKDKRAKLIDELLSRPEFGRQFGTNWRELIVDRSEDQKRIREGYSWDFIDWLAAGFNADRGWDEMVRDMLTAEGDVKSKPASTFILANLQNEFPRAENVVGMAGTLFMGIAIRCAQCHDHPHIEDWKQDDFWGMAAFFTQVRNHDVPNGANLTRNFVLSEKTNPDAAKELYYMKKMERAGLLPPIAGPKAAVPTIADPTKALRVVDAKFFHDSKPAFGSDEPYRPTFAAWLTSPKNPYFAKAAVNRLWAHFFARGLVNPVEDMGPNHPPSHPELLTLLETEFKAGKFQFKSLARAICNSETYQRTSKPLKENADDKELFSHQSLKQLTPDQTLDSLSVAVGRVPPQGKHREKSTESFATKGSDDSPTEFSHGIPQFLQQMNSGFANNKPSSMLHLMTNGKSQDDAIAIYYLTVLSRKPKPEEVQKVNAYLKKVPNAQEGFKDLYWALLNSAEFIFNR